MKKYATVSWAISVLCVAGLSAVTVLYAAGQEEQVVASATPQRFVGPPPPTAQEQREAFIGRVMDLCNFKASEAKRAILTQQIGRVLADKFPQREQGEAFVSLLCIESRFDQSAKSVVGATGIGQLMPTSAPHFARECGYGELGPNDTQDTEVNLRLGACFFSQLLVQFNGNTALALAGYNSGAGSSTTRKLAQLGTGAEETSGYLSKHYVLSEKLRTGATK